MSNKTGIQLWLINLKFYCLIFIHINAFLWKAINKAMTRPNNAHKYSDQRESSVYVNWTRQYDFKRDLNNDSDGAHLTSLEIEFQKEEEANENEWSPSVALLRAGLLRRFVVYELKRVLRVCDGFFSSMSATYDGAVLLWQW